MPSYGAGEMSKLARILRARATAWAAQRAEEEIGRADLPIEEDLVSGIRPAPDLQSLRKRPARSADPLEHEVTLIVHGWDSVQPGPMAWVFPNVRHAIAAANAMRNAIAWTIVRGKRPATALDEVRLAGAVLIEHSR
jgi:hypothetical protein